MDAGAGLQVVDVAPDDDRAAVAFLQSRRIELRAGSHVDRVGLRDRRVAALPAATDINAATARLAAGIEPGRIGQQQLVAGDDDASAGAALGFASGLHLCVDRDHAAAAAIEQHAPVAAGHAVGLDDAGVIDHGAQQCILGLGCELHLAAMGLQQAAVLDQRVQGRLVHAGLHQAVARQVQRDGAAGGQRHTALRRDDAAAVVHGVAEQGHVTLQAGLQPALVVDSGVAVAGEPVVALLKVRVGQIQRGSHQAAGVDRGALAKQDAVRVDQEHLAVGAQATQDGRRIGADHAIQGHRIGIGLHKLHCLRAADVEAAPMQHRLLAGLRDDQ